MIDLNPNKHTKCNSEVLMISEAILDFPHSHGTALYCAIEKYFTLKNCYYLFAFIPKTCYIYFIGDVLFKLTFFSNMKLDVD